MTPVQVALVQESWVKVGPIADQAAALFYGRLFEIAPEVKPLFKGDMKRQGRLLMTMIGTAVGGLTKLETIVPTVQELGRRHAGYGVKKEHYGQVADALLWTLGQGLGPAFTPAVREAWTEAYGVLAGTMIDAAEA